MPEADCHVNMCLSSGLRTGLVLWRPEKQLRLTPHYMGAAAAATDAATRAANPHDPLFEKRPLPEGPHTAINVHSGAGP